MVTQNRADLVFKALSDPTRRLILASLQNQALAVLAVSQSFPQISRPAISKHLRVLREAGLLTEEQQGRQRFYRFLEGSLDGAGAWVESFRSSGAGGIEVANRRDKVPPRPVASSDSGEWRVW